MLGGGGELTDQRVVIRRLHHARQVLGQVAVGTVLQPQGFQQVEGVTGALDKGALGLALSEGSAPIAAAPDPAAGPGDKTAITDD